MGEQGREAEDILQLQNDGVDKEGGNNSRDDNTCAAYCSLVLFLPPLATAFLILYIQGDCLCQWYCESSLTFLEVLNTGSWAQKSACLSHVAESLH